MIMSKIRNITTFFLAVDKRIHYFLVASCMCLALLNFVFDEAPELFSGGANLAVMLKNLSLAFISSYIFYIVVVHLKYMRDKEHLTPYIAMKTRQTVGSIREPLHHLILNAKADPANKYPSELELEEIGKKTYFNDPAPIAYRRLYKSMTTMQDFCNHWKSICEKRIDDVLILSPYLDTEHIKLLLEIKDSSFYSAFDSLNEALLSNDFSALSNSLYSLSQHAKALEDYCDENFPKPGS